MKIFLQPLQLCIILAIAPYVTVQAQITFQRTFGGLQNDYGQSVQQTTDGGYILLGLTSTHVNGDFDMYLIKTNSLGQVQWEQTYGDEKYQFANSVQQTQDGGYILCGATAGLGNDSLTLIKTDALGNIIWHASYRMSVHRSVGRCVRQTLDGGFIATGFIGESFKEDLYMVKTNSVGILEWSKIYGGVGREYGVSIQQMEDESFLVVGETNSRGYGSVDMYVLKTDKYGDTLWTKTYGTTIYEAGFSVDLTADGGFICLGTGSNQTGDFYLVRADANGNELWNRYYGGEWQDAGYSVEQTRDGGFFLAGRKGIGINQPVEMYCIKTDAIGNVIWDAVFPKGFISEAISAQQTTDNGYILLGSAIVEKDSIFRSDMFLVKIDSTGKLSNTENPISESLIHAYPNPFDKFTMIEFLNPDQLPITLTLFDTQGRMIKEIFNITTEFYKLERDDLGSGLYFLRLTHAKECVGQGKLIAQ